MLSVLNLMILHLDVDSLEDFADFGSAGANPVDFTENFPLAHVWVIRHPTYFAYLATRIELLDF